MTPRSLSHRAPLLGLVLAWCLGSFLTHRGLVTLPAAVWAAIAVGGLVLAWTSATHPPLRLPFSSRPLPPARIHVTSRLPLLGLALALAAAGALRTDHQRARPTEWDTLALPPREARLDLRVTRLFATPPDSGRVGGLAEVTGTDAHLRDLAGQRIQFFATWPPGPPPAHRGMRLSALGVLAPLPALPATDAPSAPPSPTDAFTRYLIDQGVNFSFNRARLLAPPSAPGAWARFRAAAALRMETILRAGLENHPHLADLHVAMMLGKKETLDDAQEDLFVRSGTMHLFAISGLHIAGIAVALHTLLALARLPRGAAFLVGTAVLWTYVEITGGTPSAIRAFWMVTCLLGARQLRAPGNSLAALVASALVVLVVAPHQLFSASFQMSYGIVAALLLYGVPLQERWLGRWQPWATLPKADWGLWRHAVEGSGRLALGVVALGLAAALVSTPASLAHFGLLAPVGFFVNLLLVPAAGLVLFAGVGSLILGGLGLTPLAVLFNHASALVLALMEKIIVGSLALPGASVPAEFVAPWLAGASGVGMLALLALGYVRGWRPREGGYWTPYAVLGLVLVLGVRAVSVAAP